MCMYDNVFLVNTQKNKYYSIQYAYRICLKIGNVNLQNLNTRVKYHRWSVVGSVGHIFHAIFIIFIIDNVRSIRFCLCSDCRLPPSTSQNSKLSYFHGKSVFGPLIFNYNVTRYTYRALNYSRPFEWGRYIRSPARLHRTYIIMLYSFKCLS